MKNSILLGLMVVVSASSVWAECGYEAADGAFAMSDGVILDARTGLEWQTCLHGQRLNDAECTGAATEVSWLDAKQLAHEQGWRLPTLEDLETVLDGEGGGGFFPKPFGLCQNGQIWTASPGPPVNDVSAVLELETGKVWGIGRGVSRYFIVVRGQIDVEYFSGTQPKL